MEPKSINEIMKHRQEQLGRIALQSSVSAGQAKHTIFIPWGHTKKTNQWQGIVRWRGNNSRSLHIDTRDGDRKMWVIYKEKWPILPRNHYLREQLDRIKKHYLRSYRWFQMHI